MVHKISKENNYQFKGYYTTPWGIFPSISEAVIAAKELRKIDSTCHVVTDSTTLRAYFNKLDECLSIEGRRTVPSWRGKTPREIGFIFKECDGKN
jgi:hypothetical protein